MRFINISELFKSPKFKKYGLLSLAVLFILVPVIKRKISISREPTAESYPVVVKLISPRVGVLRSKEVFLGLFKPENMATLSSRLSARVNFIAEEGTAVKRGEEVVRLDTSDLAASLEAANVKKQNQEKVYNRDKILFSSGAISQEQLENSQNLYQQALALYESAATQLSYGVIKAPFDAVVGKRYIQPGDTAVPGKPLLQLYGDGPSYEVYADLPVETASKIKIGSEQEIHFNGNSQKAKVVAVVPASANNLMTVKLKIDSNKLNIPAGTYVDIHFYTSVCHGVIATANSILNNMNGYFALTVKDGKAHWVPVKVLGFNSTDYCVKGIDSSMQLAEAPAQELIKIYEGQTVKAIREDGNYD